MKRKIIVFVVSVLLINASTFQTSKADADSVAPLTFSDISNSWAKKDILEAVDRGIVNGFPDGTFRPDDIVTGDQLIVMLFKAYSKVVNYPGGPQGRWNDDFLRYLNKEYPGQLGSLQAALIKDNFDFNIAKTGYWAKPFIDFAYDMGYIHSYDSVYPKNYDLFTKSIDREHATYLLGMWFEGYETTFDAQYKRLAANKESMVDINDFSQGQVSSFKGTMMLSGVMRGYPGNYFYPKRYVTRAEATAMILRLVMPERRSPYKPDLTNVYYSTTPESGIYIFDDQTKYDAYQSSIEMAKTYLKSGYGQINSVGVSVFASKDDADTHYRNNQTGNYGVEPNGEAFFTVGEFGEKYISLTYNEISLKFSENFVDASMNYLAGSGNEESLRNKVIELQKQNTGTQIQTFTINGRNYRTAHQGPYYVLQYFY